MSCGITENIASVKVHSPLENPNLFLCSSKNSVNSWDQMTDAFLIGFFLLCFTSSKIASPDLFSWLLLAIYRGSSKCSPYAVNKNLR